jgi:hypothetical protein
LNSDRIGRVAVLNELDFECKAEKYVTRKKKISFENIPYQQGFYSLEVSAGRYFGWSGSESPCFIELNENLKETTYYLFKVHVISVLEQSVLDSVQVKMNGHGVSEFEIKKCLTGGYDILFAILVNKEVCTHSVQKIEIEHSTVTEPTKQPGARQLGLAVSSVTICQK